MVRSRTPQAEAAVGSPFEVASATGPVRVVVVCSQNVARSPLVERLLRSELEALAPDGFVVRSCGTRALDGRPMADGSRRILRSRGLVSDGFVSAPMTPELLLDADLVLTAEESHARQVVAVRPALLKKTFTVLEFAAIAAGTSIEAPDARAFVRSASGARFVADDPASGELDLADPVGSDASAFVELERQLGDAAGVIARALVGAA